MNEKYLKHLLLDILTPSTPTDIRFMCQMVIVAAHQRKLLTDPFVEVVDLCGRVNWELIQLEQAAFMRNAMDKVDPSREYPWWDGAIEPHVKKIITLRKELAAKLDLFMLCPEPGSTIH